MGSSAAGYSVTKLQSKSQFISNFNQILLYFFYCSHRTSHMVHILLILFTYLIIWFSVLQFLWSFKYFLFIIVFKGLLN